MSNPGNSPKTVSKQRRLRFRQRFARAVSTGIPTGFCLEFRVIIINNTDVKTSFIPRELCRSQWFPERNRIALFFPNFYPPRFFWGLICSAVHHAKHSPFLMWNVWDVWSLHSSYKCTCRFVACICNLFPFHSVFLPRANS